MTSKIEETKREMYRALAALKSGGRWLIKKANAEAFESALEEHLEASRQTLGEKSVECDHFVRMNTVLSDAYDRQKDLTHSACVEAREYWERAFHAEREAKVYKADCISAEASADRLGERVHQQKVLIAAQRQAIGQLYMVKGVMSKQIVQLVEEVEVLKMANKVAGEELRGTRHVGTNLVIRDGNGEVLYFPSLPELLSEKA